MLTRNKAIERILAEQDTEFKRELAYYTGIEDREYPYDELSALFDVESIADEDQNAELLATTRKVMVDIGFYRLLTKEELETAVVSGGHKPWAFKKKGAGAYYTSDYTVEEVQFPEE